MSRRVVVHDHRGTAHAGPRGAWWLPVREGSNEVGTRPRAELPAARLRAWNAAAIAYAAAAVALAWRLGELAAFLGILGGLVAGAVALLWWIAATLPARYARQIGRPVATARAEQPAQPRATTAEPVAEGVTL